MYLACADPVLDEYEAIAKKHAQNIIDAHHALPWWKRMNGRLHEQARRGVMRCWQVCAEASDRRIAEMRMLPNPAGQAADHKNGG